jgi:hypothetical protein
MLCIKPPLSIPKHLLNPQVAMGFAMDRVDCAEQLVAMVLKMVVVNAPAVKVRFMCVRGVFMYVYLTPSMVFVY